MTITINDPEMTPEDVVAQGGGRVVILGRPATQDTFDDGRWSW